VLWLSGSAIPRKYSICERGLGSETASGAQQNADTNERQSLATRLSVSIVPDLSVDDRLESNPYFRHIRPTAKFYAGVPIRTRRGIDIGVYCVLDSEPRVNLDSSSIRFLQDISRTVMGYLETLSAAHGHQRNVRMVRGLGSLIEGKASMSRWWLGDNFNSFKDPIKGEEGALNAKQQKLQRIDEERQIETTHRPLVWPIASSVPADVTARGEDRHGNYDDDGENSGGISGLPTQRPASEMTLTSGNGNATSGSGDKTSGRGTTLGSNSTPDEAASTAATSAVTTGSIVGTTTGSVTQPQEDEYLIAIKALLSRGANIIRESVQCEGVLFLDAAISSFGGFVEQPDIGLSSPGESPRESSPTSSSEEGKRQGNEKGDENAKLCQVLGHSTSESASIDGDLSTLAQLSVPERFLKRLLRLYPEGYIFNFDESGAIQSGDSSEDDSTAEYLGVVTGDNKRPERKRLLKPTDRDILTQTFVGARSIGLIPLWDSNRERWFAGGFMWTRTPTRVFTTHGELSFLKAFGMALMAEAARIEGMRSSKAKADILGSVSHELRSPLHGIILGIELLNDTTLNAFQEDILHTLETCGRTLVDTINHVMSTPTFVS
jgi:hypothetical protein